MRKPEAPSHFTLSCLCPPHALISFLPNPANSQARSKCCYLRKGRCPRPVLSGATWVARCRADIETVTPQSRQDGRWRGSSEHARGGEPKLLEKRKRRGRREKIKKIIRP